MISDARDHRALRQLVLDTITAETQRHPNKDQDRRRELLTQLDRLQDLYVLGDLTKPRYVMRRQTLEEELQRLAPPANPHLDRAQELLGDSPPSGVQSPTPPSNASYSQASSTASGKTPGTLSPSHPVQPSPPTSRPSTKPALHAQKEGRKAG